MGQRKFTSQSELTDTTAKPADRRGRGQRRKPSEIQEERTAKRVKRVKKNTAAPMRMNHPTADGRPSRVIQNESRLERRRAGYLEKSGFKKPGSYR